jgi:hypothetical protein
MSFPTTLDDLDATRGSATDKLSSPSHVTHHALEDATIEALEAKVGIDSSLVTTSLSYKLSGVTGSDKAASLTGTEALTNKTLTAPKINLGSDASQDIYKRKADGTLERIPLGSANAIFGVNAAGTSAEYLALSAVTADEKAALAGQSGTAVSASNKFVDNAMVTEAKTASKIPIRDSNSDILVATTPTAGDAAASKTYVDLPFEVSASANVKYSADTERTLSDASYTLQKAIKIRVPGTVRVSFDIARTTATDGYGKVYKDGVAVGIQRVESAGNYTTFTEDFSITYPCVLQLYTYGNGSNGHKIRNFRISYDIAKTTNGSVITD